MATKSIREIEFTFVRGRKSKLVSHKKSMRTIRCACGFEILVLPDVKAMDRAIENHLAEHRATSGCSENNLALDWLRQFLTAQILRVASEINPQTVN
jgi:hypothetical protein